MLAVAKQSTDVYRYTRTHIQYIHMLTHLHRCPSVFFGDNTVFIKKGLGILKNSSEA